MGVANYFVGQSIGVDEKNTFQYIFNFLSSIKQDQYISVKISETIRAECWDLICSFLGFLRSASLFFAMCYAHSNAPKPPSF